MDLLRNGDENSVCLPYAIRISLITSDFDV